MPTPHEIHEAKRMEHHNKMKSLHPHREFITVLPPGAKLPTYIWLDNNKPELAGA